jgi:selenide,water dikinase
MKKNPNLIAGFESAEDAGVYKLTDEIALVQTVDYFPPIVDNPYDFGEIAVANALSDVYAMGGVPLTALNIVSFPKKKISVDVLKSILQGGLNKLQEAGVTLVGGHSIEDEELKYGVAITGTIHPDKIIRNNTCKVGDSIILTKPIGTGIINTALKAGLASDETIKTVTESMKSLNWTASEVMKEFGAHAATDITGFGLLGHCAEIVRDDICIGINTEAVPLFSDVEYFSKTGIVPAGTHNNRKARESLVVTERDIPSYLLDILFDAQTSGGLLFMVPEENVHKIVEELKKRGISAATHIGEVLSEPKGKILLR